MGGLSRQEHAELVACQLEDTGTGAGLARQQDGLWSMCVSSTVPPLGTNGAEHCRCTLQSRDRKEDWAGLKVQKVRRLVYIGSKATTGVLCPLASSPWTLLALLRPLTSHVHQLGRHQSLMLLPRA